SLVAELKPLSYEDTERYVQHRLEVAGPSGQGVFSPRALQIIHPAAGGIPRPLNVVFGQAPPLGYGSGRPAREGGVIKHEVRDWRPFQRSSATSARAKTRASARRRSSGRPLGKIAAAVAVGVVGAALLVLLAGQRDVDFLSRIWHGLLPAGASGTVVRSTETPAPVGMSEPEAAAPQMIGALPLPPRTERPPEPTAVERPASERPVASAPPPTPR